MEKVSVEISNNYCPQTLFLFGTYKDDGTPNFGLFCWFSYCWDYGLGVMACIGGQKLTKDRINADGVFSANLVTESMLPLADYFGHREGYDPDKMTVPVKTVKGAVLNVPILEDSPWSFELEVKRTIALNGSDIYICGIRNILADAELVKSDGSIEFRAHLAAPALTTAQTYFTLGHRMGSWGDWKTATRA